MKRYLFVALWMSSFCPLGTAQYVISVKELNQYALAARDSPGNCFVVYLNGDTLKGKAFKKKQNVISGKKTWAIDGSAIDISEILIYQDEKAYVYCYPYTKDNFGLGMLYGNEFGRLIKGKISLFSSQTSETRRDGPNSTHTMFFLSKDRSRVTNLSVSTPKQLEEMVKDYAPAVEKLKQEFKKINDKETNDYRAIIAVLKVYNEQK